MLILRSYNTIKIRAEASHNNAFIISALVAEPLEVEAGVTMRKYLMDFSLLELDEL